MLALADWAGEDGGRIYPSMSTLAKKIRMSERQAIRIMRDLVAGDTPLSDYRRLPAAYPLTVLTVLTDRVT